MTVDSYMQEPVSDLGKCSCVKEKVGGSALLIRYCKEGGERGGEKRGGGGKYIKNRLSATMGGEERLSPFPLNSLRGGTRGRESMVFAVGRERRIIRWGGRRGRGLHLVRRRNDSHGAKKKVEKER